MFEPGDNFEPSGKPKSMMSFARERMKGSAVAVAFVILTSIISNLIGIINPAFSRIFLDRLLTGVNPEWFMPFIMALALIGIIQLVVSWISAVYSLKINGKMDAVGNTTFMWKVLRMPMEFVSQRMAGDICQRQSYNSNIAKTLVSTFEPLLLNTIMMVFYMVVKVRSSLVLTLIGLISIVVDLFVSTIISTKSVNTNRVQLQDR